MAPRQVLTLAAKPPAGPDWARHDGYRLMVRRDGMAIRLFRIKAIRRANAVLI
jgi:hypothetical protein